MIKKIKRLPNDDGAGILDSTVLNNLPGYVRKELLPDKTVAVIECDQDIPCNPCEEICQNDAIKIGKPITNLPEIDINKCNGCLSCLKICPGLCIFAVKKDFSNDSSLIYIPYEYIPIPEKGTKLKALDRRGELVCEAEVYRVIGSKSESTKIIGIIIPKEYIDKVRNFKIFSMEKNQNE